MVDWYLKANGRQQVKASKGSQPQILRTVSESGGRLADGKGGQEARWMDATAMVE